MGLFDKLRGELIDIIEWIDPTNDTMVHRFERYNNEIKYGAKLIVRESQVAVFIDRGKLADVFEPGTYTLETGNLPILSTLLGWVHGFNSPFKAEVYFVSTRQFTDLKWGTKNPIMLRDPEFGPVRLRAYGTYAVRVLFAPTFIKEIVGTDGAFTTDQITDQLRNLIVARFADILGESKIPILDLAGNYDELGKFISDRIFDDFDSYGLQVTKLLVENISLPPEVEAALDKRTSMGVIGNLHAYTQFQAANAMEKAAENPGGAAGGGLGLGMGFAMAGQMGQAAAGAAQVPPPVPQGNYFVAVDGQQTGPYDGPTLKQQIQSGRLTRDSLVWAEGMAQWTVAAEVPDVAKLFGATPPPIPPK
ncbi:MAG: SPFH domain-containing protein [Candidatus Hydrogenedentes bacterium]|nr:SPFH domain-containing protein [Candidatus Hydrogenedentota bacterium]